MSTSLHLPEPPQTCDTAAPADAPDWLRRLSSAAADARRNLYAAVAFALAFLAVTGALVVIATGHTVQPFVLQASEEGAVVPAAARLQPYRPGSAERRYFLAQWARHLLALDARLSEGWLAEAYRLTRGKATTEFTDWLKVEGPLQRLKQDPSLSRSVEILGISLVDDEVALVRVAVDERSLANPAPRRHKQLLTVHFLTVLPDSEADVLRNPIGLQVTDFQVGEDLER
jgi:type IV secretion system protein TrbF